MMQVGLGLALAALLLGGCTDPAASGPPTPAPPRTGLPEAGPPQAGTAAATGVWISEVLPGIHGVDNNLEFVELYNAGPEAVDLDGWSLWYRLDDNKEEHLLYAWEGRADIPAHGHFLLARAGEDIGRWGDAEYTASLFELRGGLALRDAKGETADTLVWGEGPTAYRAGTPALPPEGGASLERLPGGDEGHGAQSGDHASDFQANPSPQPQNSGDRPTPRTDERLAIRLNLPPAVEPGSELACAVEIENLTAGPLQNVRVVLPLPPQFEILSTPANSRHSGGWLEWTLPELAGGATETGAIGLQAPWTPSTAVIRNCYVEVGTGGERAYGPLAALAVKDGTVPIATARTLRGETVTVEGTATMYTGGFFAGSTGTKFYMEDESGGIQVYCPGGMGLVEVAVGDRVRVTGLIDAYQDSIEIVPETYPDDVEILERSASEPAAAKVPLGQAGRDEELLGRLIEVEGIATRLEEFTYSYQVDLMDEQGDLLLAYIEKDTGVTVDPLETGKRYRVTGISEVYSGERQIKPRTQADLVEVRAPELVLEARARSSVQPGETFTYTLTAYNYTGRTLGDVQIVAPLPSGEAEIAAVLDGGVVEEGNLVWAVAQLAGGGASATVRTQFRVAGEAGGRIVAGPATATADAWPEAAISQPVQVFVGQGVPIWAIQGPGDRSPYVHSQVTTAGVVIGVFPELGGFWIQEEATDDDPLTSAGLLILDSEGNAPVELGYKIQVSGQVREQSGQTVLALAGGDAVTVISTGNILPAAAALDPPLDNGEAQIYYEALEGMLVEVAEPAVAVGPTNRYGETPLVLAGWGIERVMKGDPTGMLIVVDDGGITVHEDIGSLAFPMQSGDVLEWVTGPLAYTYEQYKLEPLSLPRLVTHERPLPAAEPAGPGQFSVATFNVENLFDPEPPHPGDPPLPTASQYRHDLNKTAAAIQGMGAPAVVGLQEVENLEILADLAEEGAIAPYGYQPVLIEGTDSRGIDAGYLVRSDQVTLQGAASYPAPEGLTSRPPLVITVTVHLADGDETVYLLNNHFTSMSDGELPTEPRRTAQAAWNVSLVEEILAGDPAAHVIVLGDLNSFYESPPLDVLREAGLRHVYESVEPDRPHTYVYQGESETLDHILVTPGLYERLVRVEALHINADYPPPVPGDPSARRSSDHDPLIAVFDFE